MVTLNPPTADRNGQCGNTCSYAVAATSRASKPMIRIAEFDMYFNEGISKYGDLLDFATKLVYISKKGRRFRYNEISLGKDRLNSIEFNRMNKEIANEI